MRQRVKGASRKFRQVTATTTELLATHNGQTKLAIHVYEALLGPFC